MRFRQVLPLLVTFIFIVVLSLVASLPLAAQSANSGTVVGTVTDQSGAVVAGATITLTDTATKSARTETTNDAGRYIFVDVLSGLYDLSVAKQGFSTSKTQVTVKVGEQSTANLALQVGGANVVVEVTSVGTELQTMNATVGNTVTAIAIDNLPSIGRDVSTFIELQPGVSTDGSVAGAVNDQSYFSLDGGNNSNDMDGNGSVYTPQQGAVAIGDPTGGVSCNLVYCAPSGVMPTPADSVEEFKVNTAGQTADFNSSAGAEIKVVTKRGTNAFHGTVYEYYKDNNWSSNSWQNNWLNYAGDHIGLPSYHYSRYGGAIGGPLIPKDIAGGKTFFFFNYEGFNYPNSETVVRSVPSPALRMGLLTDSGSTALGTTAGTIDYNLNPYMVTYNSQQYAGNYGCEAAPGGLCDPLGLGLTPLLSANANNSTTPGTGIWDKYEPASNTKCQGAGLCDNNNVLGYAGTLSLPIKSKFAVGRIDHDFGAKEHLMASYRYYHMIDTGDQQIDIGGVFSGDKLGTPASLSSNPIQDWFLVLGLTSNVSNNVTNDIHYSYLRNWWAWSRGGAPPQIAGLGGALELDSGQSATQDLGPYNVNNQQIRRRFWDGHDSMVRDDVSMLHGNHLFQLGGTYQHNFDYHQRNDSGGSINAYPVYSLGDGSDGALGISATAYPCGGTGHNGAPTSVTNSGPDCASLVAMELGVVSIASQVFTRSGPNLTLNPPLSNAFDKSTIPYYNFYFSDTWHLKPTLTLTYGLGWALEMPPTEQAGKQAVLVDDADEPLSTLGYLAARKRAALQGQVYNPELGFALVGNVANGQKYPYNPYYGEFSPRVAIAWSPKATTGAFGNTVVRFGYGRQYGRTNGVDQVLVPLLGLGLEQPTACKSNVVVAGSWDCLAGGDWSTAFRVQSAASSSGGPTVPLQSLLSQTLPQPVYPGYNNTFAASPEGLDPNFRPNAIDAFNFTIQKQLNRRISLEVGYIGRRITHEYQPVDLNSVPYMMTLGGQTFKSAYANTVLQYCGGVTGMAGGGCAGASTTGPTTVTAQPFFENALAGTGYCTGFANCTQAVVFNEGIVYGPGCPGQNCAPVNPNATYNLTNAQVYSLWSDLDSGAFNFPRTMQQTAIPSTCAALGGTGTLGCAGQSTFGMALNASIGYGNYNAGFASLKMADWHGLTMQSNFTWSKALGTGAEAQASSEYTPLDSYNLGQMYGTQPYDRKFTYNAFLVYQPPFYKGQSGMMGRLLGGWTMAAIFTAGSGNPVQVYTTYGNGQAWGGADGSYYSPYYAENAVPIGPIAAHSHAYYCASASNGGLCPNQTNGFPINEFKDGINDYLNWRNPILGLDGPRDGGSGYITGMPFWNMDFSLKKNIRVAENISLEFQGVFANVLNHEQQFDGFPALYNVGGWGSTGGEAGPRNMEVGARVRF